MDTPSHLLASRPDEGGSQTLIPLSVHNVVLGYLLKHSITSSLSEIVPHFVIPA